MAHEDLWERLEKLYVIYPNLLPTIEGQPILVHVVCEYRDRTKFYSCGFLRTKLSKCHVTESGFGSDIDFEKFWYL